jgi:hypothetical protein
VSIPKRVLIFGMSYHSRAVYRLLDKSIYIIVGFVENDINKVGGKFDNIRIYNIEDINSIDYDEVIISGRNIDDMIIQLKGHFGINKEKIVVMGRSDLALNINDLAKKEKKLSEMLHHVINLSIKEDIDYWMSYSSLLALKRGEEFAKFSDVDISVMSDKILLFLDSLNKNSKQYNIATNSYQKSSKYWNKGDISSITISERVDITISEPAAIDLVALSKYQESAFVPGPFEKMHCFPLSYFDGNCTISRFNLDLRVPSNVEGYLQLVYGDKWISPVERWQHKNYNSIKPQ